MIEFLFGLLVGKLLFTRRSDTLSSVSASSSISATPSSSWTPTPSSSTVNSPSSSF